MWFQALFVICYLLFVICYLLFVIDFIYLQYFHVNNLNLNKITLSFLFAPL